MGRRWSSSSSAAGPRAARAAAAMSGGGVRPGRTGLRSGPSGPRMLPSSGQGLRYGLRPPHDPLSSHTDDQRWPHPCPRRPHHQNHKLSLGLGHHSPSRMLNISESRQPSAPLLGTDATADLVGLYDFLGTLADNAIAPDRSAQALLGLHPRTTLRWLTESVRQSCNGACRDGCRVRSSDCSRVGGISEADRGRHRVRGEGRAVGRFPAAVLRRCRPHREPAGRRLPHPLRATRPAQPLRTGLGKVDETDRGTP